MSKGFAITLGVLLGAVLGFLLVKALFLDTIEQIGFSLVMNNLGSVNLGQIASSTTFLKLVVGAAVGAVAGGLLGFVLGKGKKPAVAKAA